MISTRLLSFAAAAFALVQAQSQPPQSPSRLVLDDVDAPWTYSAGAHRVNDTNEAVWYGGYTLVPPGGTSDISFTGSGIAVWFVLPPGPAGSLQFFLDGERRLTYSFDTDIKETQYDLKLFSKHRLEIKPHTLKIVSDTLAYGVDTAIYNPGAPSDDDPSDD
ncbi:hypothetical protein AURDEDRAFT_174723 [Auricularia subglabra TFB-10046 SS5]|nr:hypothetical protein AURDEDRAFT_174723 [Auricularia subglabra TFB-10046 SS5]